MNNYDIERITQPILQELRNITYCISQLSRDLQDLRRFREFVSVHEPKLLSEYHRYDMVDRQFKEIK